MAPNPPDVGSDGAAADAANTTQTGAAPLSLVEELAKNKFNTSENVDKERLESILKADTCLSFTYGVNDHMLEKHLPPLDSEDPPGELNPEPIEGNSPVKRPREGEEEALAPENPELCGDLKTDCYRLCRAFRVVPHPCLTHPKKTPLVASERRYNEWLAGVSSSTCSSSIHPKYKNYPTNKKPPPHPPQPPTIAERVNLVREEKAKQESENDAFFGSDNEGAKSPVGGGAGGVATW